MCLSPRLHQDSTGRGSPLPHLQAPRQSLPQGFRLTGTELSSQGTGLPSLPMMSWARSQLSAAPLHRIASPLYYPYVLDSVALHWSMVNLPEATFLKSTVLPRSSPCCAGIWSGLSSHGTYACCQNCCGLGRAAALLCLENSFLYPFTVSGSYTIPTPSSAMIPEPWEKMAQYRCS